MPQKINIFFIFAIFCTSSAYAQFTIPNKKFTKTNEIIFDASGFFNISASSTSQEHAFSHKYLPDNFSQNYFNSNQAIGNDTQLYLKAGVMTQDQVKYGAIAKLEYNYNSDGNNENLNLDQAFLYRESEIGKFELGNNKAVNQMMKLGPARFAKGAGGINGKYLEHVNFSMFSNAGNVCSGASCLNVKLPSFIVLPQSPIGHGGYAQGNDNQGGRNQFNRSRYRALKDDSFDGAEDATKLSYYTTRLNGLQLGLSYAPNSQDQGVTANTSYNLSALRIENIFSLGVNYIKDFDNLGFGISATAEKGNVKNNYGANQAARNDLLAYDLATTLTYFGFSFGLSYGSWGNSLQQKNGIYSCDYNANLNLNDQTCASGGNGFKNPYYYTAGIAYEFGPVNASITGMNSVFAQNTYQAISFGLDYKYRKNIIPYFEITRFAFKSNQVRAADIADQTVISNSQRQLKDNSGFVLLTGVLLSF